MRVLIVEDSSDLRQLFVRLLKSKGFRVYEASNGLTTGRHADIFSVLEHLFRDRGEAARRATLIDALISFCYDPISFAKLNG